MPTPMSLTGRELKRKWKLGALVGKGACSDVYGVTDILGGAAEDGAYVAKIAPLLPKDAGNSRRRLTEAEKAIRTNADLIYYEFMLYQGFLRGHEGIAEIPAGAYGEDHNHRFLVMTRLGPDVQTAKEEGESWDVARTAGYARQMLNLLRLLHEKCRMVFVDVKPENFLFGKAGSDDEDKIFLIDFGLSSRSIDAKGAVKPQVERGFANVQGTPEYLSLKCHGGATAGRCDDLESLGYVIVSLLSNSSSNLPWSGSTSVVNGFNSKRNTSLETLCAGCPAGMLKYMRAVRAMAYEEAPDYARLDAMLHSMALPASTECAARPASPATSNGRTTSTRSAPSGRASSSPMATRGRPDTEADASVGPPTKLRRSARLSK